MRLFDIRIESTFFGLLVINILIYLTWTKCDNFRQLGKEVDDLTTHSMDTGLTYPIGGTPRRNANPLGHCSQNRRGCFVARKGNIMTHPSLTSGRAATCPVGVTSEPQPPAVLPPAKGRPFEKSQAAWTRVRNTQPKLPEVKVRAQLDEQAVRIRELTETHAVMHRVRLQGQARAKVYE